MESLAATIDFADEKVPVLLSPALKTMAGGPLKQSPETKRITLVELIDSHTLEPALYHNPYFVLPVNDQHISYLNFLEALRHTDQFALANLVGSTEQCLIYPYRSYLMLVLITSTEELIEPKADWEAELPIPNELIVANTRAKLEALNRPLSFAHTNAG